VLASATVRRIVVALLLVAALSPRADAAARVVTLLGVGGAGGDRFAELIEQDLGDLYQVISGEVYKAAAERLGKRGASPEEVQAVASALRIDAVIGGAIVGAGRSRKLLIAVRSGATGRVISRGRYDLSSRTLPMIRERVVADLVRALEYVGDKPPAGEPPVVAEEEPSSSPSETVSAPAEADPTLSVERRAPVAAPATQGLEAGVGFSVLTRALSFDTPSAPSYAGGTVGGVRADGSVFPFALSAELAQAHPVLASFGVSGSYEHVFNFTSSVGGGQSAGHASRWSILFVGRIPLGRAARFGTLTVETGFQQLAWGHQSALDVGVPDVKYDLVDAGLGWDRALVGRWLALAVRGAYLAPLSAGDIESAAQYGRSTGWGVEFDGGLTSRPLPWLWLRIDARYSRVALSFAGAGTRFAHGSADQWASGSLEVGFAL
jgi:hypothetical protein